MPGTTGRADPQGDAVEVARVRWTLRPELADMASYAPHDHAGIEVKLDANEAPPARSPRIREVVLRALERVSLERYPDPRALRLKEAIARRTGAAPDDLLVGAGSDEVIALVINALAAPRPKAPQGVVLTPTPTFVMYRIGARAHGMKPVEVPLDASWDLDAAMMERAVAMMQPNVVFVASPNSPTGNRMSDDRLARVLDACGRCGQGGAAASPALAVVDEAYVDFVTSRAACEAGASVRALRASHPHMAVLRTMSKVGLAALRVGWLEADHGLVREIDKVRQPFNLSATSQAAAAAVLEEAWDELRAEIARITSARDALAAELAKLPGFAVTPSDANFVWVKAPAKADLVHAHLVRDKILVRSFHASGGRLASQLRITVGTDAEHDRLLASLRRLSPAPGDAVEEAR